MIGDIQQQNLYPVTTKHLEDVKGIEENVDGCCKYNMFKVHMSIKALKRYNVFLFELMM